MGERKDSQIGQLLLYLLGAQLQRLQVIRKPKKLVTPILGLYMENLEVV
jgi:hypothetical protein